MTGEVQARGIIKRYGNTVALNGVDVDLHAGQITLLIGPSGCGKTTLLNMIAGFEEPSAGTLMVDGEAVHGPDPRRGVIFYE